MDSVTKSPRGAGLKDWRILVRNLKFETNEEDIRKLAGKFGEILEINLPKCKDKHYLKSCAGFCFIQFKRRADAEKAKEKLNFCKFNGRKISLDWALNKDSYITTQQEEKSKIIKQIKEEPLEMNSVKKEEMETDDTTTKCEQLSETDEDDYDTCHSEEASETESDIDDDAFNEEKDVDDIEMSDEFSDEEEDQKINKTNNVKNGKKTNDKEINENMKNSNKVRPGDIALSEGRVVFLRNLPINSTDEKLKDWLLKENISPFSLAILCRSKLTNYPTGAAFVHLEEKSTAELFLEKINSAQGMLFDGRRLMGYCAVDRKSANTFKSSSQKEEEKSKDKRNLYLLRASLIRKGTPQEKGMSEDDAKLREKFCQLAKKRLENLITFVSPTRLAIHNIPFKFTDEQLRHLCRASAGVSDQSILECRIMRQVNGKDAKGKPILGKSSGYGFVSFKEHTAALQCLKQMNNNPHMFTNERRPIVEFSIENLNALRIKERRLQMSRGEIMENANNNKRQQQKKDNKSDNHFKTGNDPLSLEKTKKELMKGGQKFLPKKFGEKKRHNKDLNQQNKRRKRSNKDDNQKWKRKKGSSKN